MSLYEDQELELAACVYVRHLQNELSSKLTLRDATNPIDWKVIIQTMQRLEAAVDRYQMLRDARGRTPKTNTP